MQRTASLRPAHRGRPIPRQRRLPGGEALLLTPHPETLARLDILCARADCTPDQLLDSLVGLAWVCSERDRLGAH